MAIALFQVEVWEETKASTANVRNPILSDLFMSIENM